MRNIQREGEKKGEKKEKQTKTIEQKEIMEEEKGNKKLYRRI